MPHSANRELMLGVLVGTAGIGLLLLWHRRARKPGAAPTLPQPLPLGRAFESVTVGGEVPEDRGTAAVSRGRQLQILEKLNELLTSVEDLRGEIRALREAVPLEGRARRGRAGGAAARGAGRRRGPARGAATSSSEEAESEGGCCKEDGNFRPSYPEHQVTSDPWRHGTSSVTQSGVYPDLQTSCPSLRTVSLSKGNKKLSSALDTPPCLSPSGKRYSLFGKFPKSAASLQRQQSRANFDSEEKGSPVDFKSASEHFGSRSRKHLSTPKLSIISCYESTMFFDLQSSSENIFDPNEIEIVSKNSSIADAEKYIISCSPEYNIKHFMNFETKVNSSGIQNPGARNSHRQSTATYLSLAPFISCTYQQNEFGTDSQERSQPRKDSLHYGSQQHPSQSITTFPRNVGLSSFRKHSRRLTIPILNEVISDSFEDENIANSSQDEDISSPTEIPNIRYITASTDTEEQNFPVHKPLNTHVEELKLDALLQKADNLRMNASGKVESFELLCDYKEKFRDEIEFIWRFVRAYGDMYELSTDTQEKKQYANIGKTLGEKAVTRAPMNGHCHLWYAVLCGYVSDFEGLQNKINCGHCFKEHLDKAITLLPEEPFLYYLNGRYCYAVSKLSWIEKKMAATLFGKIPSSTVQEALQNFLKVEELHPGFSKSNYMFLAKCYIDLKQKDNALKFCNLAVQLPCVTREDKDAHEEVKKLSSTLKR